MSGVRNANNFQGMADDLQDMTDVESNATDLQDMADEDEYTAESFFDGIEGFFMYDHEEMPTLPEPSSSSSSSSSSNSVKKRKAEELEDASRKRPKLNHVEMKIITDDEENQFRKNMFEIIKACTSEKKLTIQKIEEIKQLIEWIRDFEKKHQSLLKKTKYHKLLVELQNYNNVKYEISIFDHWYENSISANVTDGSSLLTGAAYRGHTEIVRKLLEAGASPDARLHEVGDTPLILSANVEITKSLIEYKASLDSTACGHLNDGSACTALSYAIMNGRSDIVWELLKANASIDDNDLDLAVKKDAPISIPRMLLERADFDLTNHFADTFARYCYSQDQRNPDILFLLNELHEQEEKMISSEAISRNEYCDILNKLTNRIISEIISLMGETLASLSKSKLLSMYFTASLLKIISEYTIPLEHISSFKLPTGFKLSAGMPFFSSANGQKTRTGKDELIPQDIILNAAKYGCL